MGRTAHLRQLDRVVEIRKIQMELREIETARAEAAKRRADEEQQEEADLLCEMEAEWTASIARGGLSSGMGILWGNALLDQQGAFVAAEHAAGLARREAEQRKQALGKATYCHDVAGQSARSARSELMRRREEKALAAATDQHPYRWRMS